MAHEIRVGSVTLSVEDEGTGQVVVFIHGWTCSGRFFQRQLPYFARSHRVVIPDLRGHGRSEKTLGGHTLLSAEEGRRSRSTTSFQSSAPFWWAGQWEWRWRGSTFVPTVLGAWPAW